MNDDVIYRQAAIDAVAFGITYAKAFDKETGEVRELFAQGNYELRKAVDRIKELPSTDAVDVVRCKDCINYTKGKDEWGSCFENPLKMWRDTDYCSFGEREEYETD